MMRTLAADAIRKAEEMVTSENKCMNAERSSLESRKVELERQMQESCEAAASHKS